MKQEAFMAYCVTFNIIVGWEKQDVAPTILDLMGLEKPIEMT